jgi:hypothetical protein
VLVASYLLGSGVMPCWRVFAAISPAARSSLDCQPPGARAAHAPRPTAGSRKASAPPGARRACARALRVKSASAASASAAQPGRDSQPRAQARDRGRCVEISPGGAPGRPARAAHAPGPTAVMRGSPPRHKRASGLREPGTGPSILRRLNTRTRRPTEQWRTRLRFAPVHSYWRSILRAL